MEKQKKSYTFKFYKLILNNKNILLYDDYFNLNHKAVKECVINYLTKDIKKYNIDDDRFGLISCIKYTDDFFLGKYSVAYNPDCNHTETIKYSNYNIEPDKNTGTTCFTFFYIDFKTNNLIFMQRADVKVSISVLNKALSNTVIIKPEIEEKWREKLAEKFTLIKKMELRYFDDDENNKFLESITKLGDIQKESFFDGISLNLSRLSKNKLLKKLSQIDVKDFNKLKIIGINEKGKSENFDCIKQILEKKIYIDMNIDDVVEDKIIEVFKSLTKS